jgi:hypothetical protein
MRLFLIIYGINDLIENTKIRFGFEMGNVKEIYLLQVDLRPK